MQAVRDIQSLTLEKTLITHRYSQLLTHMTNKTQQYLNKRTVNRVTTQWAQRLALSLGMCLLIGGLLPHTGTSQTTNTKGQAESATQPQHLHVTPEPSSAPEPHPRGTCYENIPCYKKTLETVLKKLGTEQALQVIEEIVKKDHTALREAHNLTHYVGRMSYHHLKDVTAVMSQCTPAHQSGCYHGALEAYLTSKPKIQPDDVVAICNPKLEKEKGRFAYFNCFHGLGHGLTMHLNHDIKQALALCDTLHTEWDQQSCYGGVFMEGVVAGINGSQQHSGHHGTHSRHHQDIKLIEPTNPLYPCSDLDEKYLSECYMMQTSIILHLTQYDFAKAFRECDKAPETMRPTCYQSMGRDISGHTLRNIEQSTHLCQLGTATHQNRCFIGVVKNFLNVSGRASDNAFEFCRQIPEQHKRDCHYAIGEELLTLYAEPQQRTQACARSETAYTQDCRQGARLALDQSSLSIIANPNKFQLN
ncbi:MAG: hypothetical protein NPIRA02_30740 [Nitrospirales bacterium]|nr:MAG: hypothetical protein NPIRA02_30740 [Nitrospirales bacterium]